MTRSNEKEKGARSTLEDERASGRLILEEAEDAGRGRHGKRRAGVVRAEACEAFVSSNTTRRRRLAGRVEEGRWEWEGGVHGNIHGGAGLVLRWRR